LNGRKKILVTGAGGQLGMEFRAIESEFDNFDFIFAGKAELPVENEDAVSALFAAHKFFACINCAAYTAVDQAEVDKEKAMQINRDAVGILAAACKRNHTLFVHFSTDYVFNGQATQPYLEDAQTDPVNFYGQTKLMGEQAALQINAEALIIRTSWVYSRFGKNFVKTMLRLMKERDSIAVVADQFGSPTYAADLAQAVMFMLQSETWIPGIFHYSNEGITSWFDFARAIGALTGWEGEVRAITTAEFPTPAKRPGYSALSKHKISNAYGIKMLDWKERLASCISQMEE
jgi:dTDP-4-dehydrorhamnose reductase